MAATREEAKGRSDHPPPIWQWGRGAAAQIGLYFVLLMLFDNLGSGPNCLAYIPLQFLLKDHLKLTAVQVSAFNFYTNLPAYVGFLFGMLRDRWRPFRRGDLGYFLLLPPLIAACFVWLAYGPMSYERLFLAALISGTIGTLLGAASQGLLAGVAQEDAMCGRLSAALLMAANLPLIVSYKAGGWLTGHVKPQNTFLLTAALGMAVSVMALWRPRAVFGSEEQREARLLPEGTLHAVKRLLGYRPLYPAALIVFLWYFAPGWQTPLMYYLTNTVKLSDESYGDFQALQTVFIVLASFLYAPLCLKVRLRPMLWWSTLFGSLIGTLFLYIHNAPQAMLVAAVTGIVMGIGNIVYMDLFVRACPPGLEGTAMMLVAAAQAFGIQSSDWFGSWLYDYKGVGQALHAFLPYSGFGQALHGFTLALLVSNLFTALIFPVLLFVPRRLTQSRDGEPPSLRVG